VRLRQTSAGVPTALRRTAEMNLVRRALTIGLYSELRHVRQRTDCHVSTAQSSIVSLVMASAFDTPPMLFENPGDAHDSYTQQQFHQVSLDNQREYCASAQARAETRGVEQRRRPGRG